MAVSEGTIGPPRAWRSRLAELSMRRWSPKVMEYFNARYNGAIRKALSSDLLTWYLGNVSAFWAFEGGCDRIMYLQFGAGELCMSLVQGRAESLENSRSMRRTEWGQRDTELIFGGFEIGGIL